MAILAANTLGPINPTFIALVIAMTIAALERYTTLLDRFKKTSAVDAASELLIADRLNARKDAQIAELRAQKIKLEQEALSPILEQLRQNAELQAQVLDRLITNNGSFQHMQEAMAEITKGLQVVVGFITELHDIPLNLKGASG